MRLSHAGIVGAGALLLGCASVSRPPGGPDDKAPPQIVAVSIDTNATNVTAGQLEIRFDEVISERPSAPGTGSGPVTLEAVVLVSPRTGSAKVQWHRDRITIEPRGGFRPNTTYRITLLPGLADIRGNVRNFATSFVFSTGPKLLPYSILGRVFDWQTNGVAQSAIVEAVAGAGTPDSLIYLAVADSVGQFDLGPLGPGTYLVRTFIDADRNRDRGVLEKWDSVTVDVTDHRPSIELRAIQRDTAAIGILRVDVLDSLWVRIALDKPFDPRTSLQPALVSIKRVDSTEVQIQGLMTEAQAAFIRPRSDSTAKPAPLPAADETSSARPPALKPAIPPPDNAVVVRLDPSTPLKAGDKYTVTLRGIRNLVGRAGTASGTFDAPRPPTVKPPPA